ncbi:SAM-dependent methyltransferase [Paraburkholderia sp. RAU6.4a]|uniref:methyltransferase domain-containing protein n=1 Tax=Paraburkholderia sp. RAU6.4a TaxID=2991067 RepID=UPI003D1F1C23
MHVTALEIGKKFFDTYVSGRDGLKIVDIGSQDVNGSLRSVAPRGCEYIGLDFVGGKGVDIVLTDPYSLPVPENSIDVIVCSSCMEHSEFFWLLFLEMQRLLKPEGIVYLNVPSNGNFHRYPVDCWRFFPDSGVALQNWARRSGYKTTLIESFTGIQKQDVWNDFVAVFVKDADHIAMYPERIQATYNEFTNGITFETDTFANQTDLQEDQQQKILNQTARDTAVAERNAAEAERAGATAARDAAVAARDAAVAARDAAVAERDAAVGERDAAVAERDAAVAERDAAVAERDAALANRDAAVEKRDAAFAERLAAVDERDVAILERNAAMTERDRAEAERHTALRLRDAAIAAHDAIVASTSWKLTAPLRRLRGFLHV